MNKKQLAIRYSIEFVVIVLGVLISFNIQRNADLKREKKEISEYVFSTLKYLIPTIPMFVLFPILIERTNFYITVFLCCLSIMLLIYLLNLYFLHCHLFYDMQAIAHKRLHLRHFLQLFP